MSHSYKSQVKLFHIHYKYTSIYICFLGQISVPKYDIEHLAPSQNLAPSENYFSMTLARAGPIEYVLTITTFKNTIAVSNTDVFSRGNHYKI